MRSSKNREPGWVWAVPFGTFVVCLCVGLPAWLQIVLAVAAFPVVWLLSIPIYGRPNSDLREKNADSNGPEGDF